MKSKNRQNSGGIINTMSQIWFKYFPYWPLFAALLLVCLGAAWLKSQYNKPEYEAAASILIKDNTKGTGDPNVVESLDQLKPKSTLENEIEVLKSKPVMNHVVRNLHLYAPVYEKGKFVDLMVYNGAPVKIIAQNPDSIRYADKVKLKFDQKAAKVTIEDTSYPLNTWVSTKFGVFKFIPNAAAANNKNELYFSLRNPESVAGDLAGRLDIAPSVKTASVLSVKITDEVPTRAKAIVDELIAVYNQSNAAEKNSLAANTLTFLDKRLTLVSKQLDSIEKKSQQYKVRSGAVNINSQGEQYLANVNALDQKINNVNTQLSVLGQVEQYVQSKNNKGGVVPSTLGVEDPALSQLVTRLYDTELQYEKAKRTMGENHPDVQAIAGEMQQIRPSIIENIQNQRKNLLTSRGNLAAANNTYSSMVSTIPQKERELLDINREHAQISNIYNFLLQQREAAALSFNNLSADTKVINRAEAYPVSDSNTKYYIISIIVALIIGVAIVNAKEIFTNTILFRHEIENYTSFPVIGEIAYDNSREILQLDGGDSSIVAAHFRKLRTSLHFLGINSKRKRIMVTSTISGEGKSYIVANLGLSLALTGKKVVLLEFDLSNPTLSKKLNISDTNNGLTNFLLDEKEPEEIIKQTDRSENLFIISSGALADKPSELITSATDKIENLLKYLDGIFDYIIIDTAPIGPMTDAYVLSNYCDATLYVVRHKFTPKVFVQRIDEENKINNLNNPAIVFNAVQSRGFSKNSYGYGYGYGYEYGYKMDQKGNESQKRIAQEKVKN